MHSSIKFQILFWMKLSHSDPLCFCFDAMLARNATHLAVSMRYALTSSRVLLSHL